MVLSLSHRFFSLLHGELLRQVTISHSKPLYESWRITDPGLIDSNAFHCDLFPKNGGPSLRAIVELPQRTVQRNKKASPVRHSPPLHSMHTENIMTSPPKTTKPAQPKSLKPFNNGEVKVLLLEGMLFFCFFFSFFLFKIRELSMLKVWSFFRCK